MRNPIPEVTIALVTYNRASFLASAIDAILRQTYKNFELVILDNHSSDTTPTIASTYLFDKRVYYMRNDKNIGGIANINKAFDIARGKYIIITHDDDQMDTTMIEQEVMALDQNPDLNLVACNINLMNTRGDVFFKNALKITHDITFDQKEFIRLYFEKNMNIPCPTVMMRRSFFNKNSIRFRDEVGPGADTICWFEANLHPGKIRLLSESLYNYRIHNEQDSQRNFFQLYKELHEYFEIFLIENQMQYLLPKVRRNYYALTHKSLIKDLLTGVISRKVFVEKKQKLPTFQFWPPLPYWWILLIEKLSLFSPRVIYFVARFVGKLR